MRARRWNAAVGGTLGIVVLCALLLPAGAFGATANTRIKRVWYTAASGEVNNLTITLSGQDYTLSETGATITAEPNCTGSGNTVTCPAADIIGLTVTAGDGDETIRNMTSTPSTLSGGDGVDSLEGGSGNDTLRGNKGLDTHSGGAGDDFIDSRGDLGDVVSCGIGNDSVRADPMDSVAPDCESVDRGIAPPPTPQLTSGPSAAARALLGRIESLRLQRGACTTDKRGTRGNDRLDGTTLGDNLFGLQGNDILNGLPNDDCLFGSAGSDRLSGAEGDDRLLGDDRKGRGGNDRLSGNTGSDLLVGGPGKDRLSGNAGGDRLRGGKGNDRLIAGGGRNHLSGGSGNDRLNAANGRSDRLNCGPGRDTARVDRLDRVRGCEQVRRRR